MSTRGLGRKLRPSSAMMSELPPSAGFVHAVAIEFISSSPCFPVLIPASVPRSHVDKASARQCRLILRKQGGWPGAQQCVNVFDRHQRFSWLSPPRGGAVMSLRAYRVRSSHRRSYQAPVNSGQVPRPRNPAPASVEYHTTTPPNTKLNQRGDESSLSAVPPNHSVGARVAGYRGWCGRASVVMDIRPRATTVRIHQALPNSARSPPIRHPRPRHCCIKAKGVLSMPRGVNERPSGSWRTLTNQTSKAPAARIYASSSASSSGPIA
jgi:hypothetical protein